MVRMPITFVASVSIMMGSIGHSCAEDLFKNADIAYGEYLAGECVTCHRSGSTDSSIPNIAGADVKSIATALHLFKTKERENKVMQLVADRLDIEQIASLAVYFASLSPDYSEGMALITCINLYVCLVFFLYLKMFSNIN